MTLTDEMQFFFKKWNISTLITLNLPSLSEHHIMTFNFQVLDIFTLRLSREDPNLPFVIHNEAAYAYDAAILLLRSMSAISNSVTLTEDVLKVIDDRLDSYTGGGVTVRMLY